MFNKNEFNKIHLLPNVTRSKRSLSQTHHHVVFKRMNTATDDEYGDYGELFMIKIEQD